MGRNDIGYGFNYEINNTVLEFLTSYIDLGVTVDRDLNFHCHVRILVCRAPGLASNLLRLTGNRSPEFMVSLFITHVRLILDYCSCL